MFKHPNLDSFEHGFETLEKDLMENKKQSKNALALKIAVLNELIAFKIRDYTKSIINLELEQKTTLNNMIIKKNEEIKKLKEQTSNQQTKIDQDTKDNENNLLEIERLNNIIQKQKTNINMLQDRMSELTKTKEGDEMTKFLRNNNDISKTVGQLIVNKSTTREIINKSKDDELNLLKQRNEILEKKLNKSKQFSKLNELQKMVDIANKGGEQATVISKEIEMKLIEQSEFLIHLATDDEFLCQYVKDHVPSTSQIINCGLQNIAILIPQRDPEVIRAYKNAVVKYKAQGNVINILEQRIDTQNYNIQKYKV